MELTSGEIVAGTCFEIEPDVWVTVSMDIAIDERQLFERLMTRNSEYQAFTISGTGDELTLSRTDCLPLPDCEDEAPLEVVVHRAP